MGGTLVAERLKGDAALRVALSLEKDEKERFLKERGWRTWHSDSYWVNPKTVEDKSRQDYTNYGLSMDDAIRFEFRGEPWSGQLLRGSLRW